eukprot:CAMPEP_0198209822 /NCGR_PEP_ID=MMETSP1445-20131203/17753_1 /TAXON_ID=36898 /ORGANISM="Pyramimonas sp., Strain CCMP2087" /LENGTH=65 /DNA_ID=CAMNT_0043883709 /DNA_START=156 /DNA_END=350 /DNA_ORIENTATION=+
MKAAGSAVMASVRDKNPTGVAKVAKSAQGAESVRVVVRCRPLFGKELDEGRERIVDMDLVAKQIT